MDRHWSAQPTTRALVLCLLAASISACGGSSGSNSSTSSSTPASQDAAPPPLGPAAAQDPADGDDDAQRRQPMIVGGSQASQAYPFAASLLAGNGQQFCGGTLIASQWVVTAAHCVIPELSSVRLGSNNSTSGGQVVQVAQSIRHPGYNANNISQGNDIALLKLASAVTGIAPVAIGSATPTVGSTVRLLGWGQTTPVQGDNSASPTLKELDSPIVPLSNCGQTQAGDICVGSAPDATSCFGDSGGPALAGSGTQWSLVGATSRAIGSTCGNDTIYTDVTHFRNWLAQYTQGAGPDPDPGPDVGAPCEDCTKIDGTLNGPGGWAVYPEAGYFYSTSGTNNGWLIGPSEATYDLELYRWGGNRWRRVARQSSVNGAQAALSHQGQPGYYAWQVISRSGSGAYSLYLSMP